MFLIEPINAIRPWECYEYQGHVTLYITLKEIFSLLQSSENTSSYDVQIEGEEDFALRKDGKYISLHQVKAGAINLTQNQKFAFIIGILQNEAKYGYFHISNKEELPIDFISKTLMHISTLKSELTKKVIERKDIPVTDKEEDYIVVDKVSGNHKRADIYSIIKYVSKNSEDITKIESVINDMDSALDEYKSIIEEKIATFKMDNPTCNDDQAYLCVYDEKYDNAKELRIKAYELIVKILKIKCPDYSFVDVDYASLVYDQLFLYMKEKMTDFNTKNEVDSKCILSFDEILEQIVVDYHEKFLCRNKFINPSIKN